MRVMDLTHYQQTTNNNRRKLCSWGHEADKGNKAMKPRVKIKKRGVSSGSKVIDFSHFSFILRVQQQWISPNKNRIKTNSRERRDVLCMVAWWWAEAVLLWCVAWLREHESRSIFLERERVVLLHACMSAWWRRTVRRKSVLSLLHPRVCEEKKKEKFKVEERKSNLM